MSLIVWVLGALALAGPRGKDREEQSARAAADREAALACEADTPEGYQIHTGFATDPDEASALESARLSARRLALESLCAGKSEPRCAVISRHIEGWKLPFYHPYTHRACAHVGVNRRWIDDDSHDQERLTQQLQALARDVVEALGDELLWITPPLWSGSGCHAGEVGTAMIAELRNGLAATGGVRLATERQRAAQLEVNLSLSGDQVVLGAALRRPGDEGLIPLEGFRFPRDLFDVKEGSGDCRFDRELGLIAGLRSGDDGRTVRVIVPGGGSYCEGDRITPTVKVDRPSTVRVFSVGRSGKAYLVWPPPGQDGLVQHTASLGVMDLHPTPNGGDEKLVAVAVAPGGELGPIKDWSAFCAVSAFTAALYPSGAAAGAATFQVQRFDADACLVRDVPGGRAPPIPVVPTCGVR